MSRGITSAADRSDFTTGLAVGPRTGHSDDSVTILVESGASGHLFDGSIILIADRLINYKGLDVRRKIPTDGGRGEWYCAGTAPGPLHQLPNSAALVNS